MTNAELAEEFLKNWRSGATEFTIYTSGSTGEPKQIVLERKWMEWSAEKSASIFKPQIDDILFCCLPLDKVGGLMMLVRSEIWKIPVVIVEARANPLLTDIEASIISLTPHQLYHIFQNSESMDRLLKFREVLIGGSDINSQMEKTIQSLDTQCIFKHSYGMTETYSHVAIRSINQKGVDRRFRCLEGNDVVKDEDGCALIHTPYYPSGIRTNDLIETFDDGSFRILGRKDFIINSGGVKLSPERVEELIEEKLESNINFVISSIKDTILGEKLVLVCNTKDLAQFENMDLSFLKTYNPYSVPKSIIGLEEIPVNTGGKTDRKKIRQILEASA